MSHDHAHDHVHDAGHVHGHGAGASSHDGHAERISPGDASWDRLIGEHRQRNEFATRLEAILARGSTRMTRSHQALVPAGRMLYESFPPLTHPIVPSDPGSHLAITTLAECRGPRRPGA